MREHLFRAQRKDTKQWVYGSLVTQSKSTFIIPKNDTDKLPDFVEVNPETVSECSGLLDGSTPPKQVFDGDILRSNEYPFYSKGIDQYYGVVFWDEETACFGIETVRSAHATVNGCSDGNCDSLEDIKDFQVIGNVYDNANLLRDNYIF